MMTRIVEVENGERVRKLYQSSTGHNHAEDAEMPQSQPAEVQPESHSNASAKNHKKGLFVFSRERAQRSLFFHKTSSQVKVQEI